MSSKFTPSIVLLIGALGSLALGCQAGDESEVPPAVPAVEAVDHLGLARSAIGSSNRPAADVADDEKRRPDEVLAFFGIEPGMRVLDVLAGAGYYSEILAGIVGSEGRVLCQNNQSYLNFMGESYGERFADDRLPNVERLDVEIAELNIESGSLDAVTFVLGFHDLYFRPADGSWPEMDAAALLAEFYDALVPGGVLGIVDHAAAQGGDTIQVATTLHRIDEAAVRAAVEEAGFVFDGEVNTLRNPDDAFDRLGL